MPTTPPKPPTTQQLRAVDPIEKRTIDLTMPYDEARQVVWPFRGLNAPIGELVEQRRVDAQDLGFAMEKANDGRVRSAARTMLTYYLGLPQTVQTTQHSGPRIIQGSRHLQDQERWSFAELSYMLGLASGFGVMIVGAIIQEWFKGTLTIPVLVVCAILLSFSVRQVYTNSRRAYKEYKSYKRGQEGEDRVAAHMQAHLDGQWTIFRNLLLPGRRDDIDFVLVGPAGVWAVETKTYSEGTRISGRSNKRRLLTWGKGGHPLSPDQQAANNAARLKLFLQQRGTDIRWVNAVVAFAEYKPLDFTDPTGKAEVWHNSNLATSLERLNAASPAANGNSANVLEILQQLPDK